MWKVNQVWTGHYKTEYEFDVNGRMTSFINYDWEYGTRAWGENDKWEYEYDAYGDMILARQTWLIGNEAFSRLRKFTGT